jgi:hypothetical protein
MDRYNEEDTIQIKRSDKNQELYQDVINNPKYANITDVTNANAYEINNSKNPKSSYSTREAYQNMLKYQNVEPVPRVKKELEDFNYLYQRDEKKVYDINSVLETARKNRQEKDALEEKRKLKNTSYNILAGLNKEELEKYREEKKKRLTNKEEQEIRELIDTIASKTLAGEIDKATSIDLLSDLMATNVFDKVDKIEAYKDEEKELKEEVVEEDKEKVAIENAKVEETVEEDKEVEEANVEEKNESVQEEPKEENKDPDFYTRSMDLSDQDFDMSDDFKEKTLPLPVKILLALLIIAVILVAAYFIYQKAI